MPILIPYLFKLFVSLGIVFLFYQLVLRRVTFYNANRWYLMGFTVLCFFVPFINVTTVVSETGTTPTLIQYIPSIQAYSIGLEEAAQCPVPLWSSAWTKWDWLLLVFAGGACFLLLRFAVRCLSFFRLKSRAKLISAGELKIYHVNEAIIPFSFGNSIFINSTQHTENELREIIRHEFIHVKQKHTADILWAELLCMLNWYNPFAWALKNAMRQNLEFIADHQVLENGVDKKQYQYLLLKVIGNDQFSIAQKFNFSSLKKRIAMMNKTRSARVNLLRFLIMLPVIAIILISFREQFDRVSPTSPQIVTDTIPDVKTPNEKGYIINIRDNKGHCMVEVKDIKGIVVDKLLLTKWNDNKNVYVDKYGQIPPPPPPDAPAEPLMPVTSVGDVAPVSPVTSVTAPTPITDVVPALPVRPVEAPVPPVPLRNADKLITSTDNFEITDKKAVLHLKNGTTETYDLTNKQQRAQFESRWGKIIESSDLSPVAIVSHSNGQTVIAPMAPLTPMAGVMAIDDNGAVITGKEDILVTITKFTRKQELEQLRQQMKAKGVDLTFDETEYDSKGVLKSISGQMRSGDNRSNFVATDFQKVVLAMIRTDDGRTYFKVNISNDREVVESQAPKPAPSSVAPYERNAKPGILFPQCLIRKKDNC